MSVGVCLPVCVCVYVCIAVCVCVCVRERESLCVDLCIFIQFLDITIFLSAMYGSIFATHRQCTAL